MALLEMVYLEVVLLVMACLEVAYLVLHELSQWDWQELVSQPSSRVFLAFQNMFGCVCIYQMRPYITSLLTTSDVRILV